MNKKLTKAEVVADALKTFGERGATPPEVAKQRSIKRAGYDVVVTGNALGRLWRKGLASRETAPTELGRDTFRYRWLPEPVDPPEPSRKYRKSSSKKTGAPQVGPASLVDAVTDFLAQDQAKRERISRAREHIVQALTLLSLPDDQLLEEQLTPDTTNNESNED